MRNLLLIIINKEGVKNLEKDDVKSIDKNIKSVIDEFSKLHEYIKNLNIKDIFDGNDDRIIIKLQDSESKECFENTLVSIIDAVKSDIDLDLIINELKTIYNEENFWGYLRKIVDSRVIPYRQSEFIRKMPVDIKYNFFREVFENQFLEVDTIENIVQRLNYTVEEKQIHICVNIISVLEHLIVVRRLSRIRFIAEVREYFGFDESDIIFLWDILFKNKQELTNRYIVNSLMEMQELIDNLDKRTNE